MNSKESFIEDKKIVDRLKRLERETRNTFGKKVYTCFFKRVADIGCSFICLILFFILLPFVAIAIKIDSRGPVFFKQQRVGKFGRLFNIYKLRTMYIDQKKRQPKKPKKDAQEFSPDDERITPVGKFLRRFSIDELPQFICIFKGDMSVIGPRAWVPEEVKQLSEKQLYRLAIKPGITGYAQINGRKNLTMDEKVEKDLYYLKHMSAWLDIKILFKTIFAVFSRDGAF